MCMLGGTEARRKEWPKDNKQSGQFKQRSWSSSIHYACAHTHTHPLTHTHTHSTKEGGGTEMSASRKQEDRYIG